MAATDMIRGRQTATRTLTNKSGGAVALGDVVVIGDATNDNAFTTTTSAAFNSRMVGVAMEAIASNAAGLVAISGYVPIVVTNASVARDVFLFTHTVAKQAAGNATRSAGAFGQVLETGTSPEAIIWGMPDSTAAAGGSVATDAIWDAAGDLALGTGANTAARLAIGANATVLTSNGTTASWAAPAAATLPGWVSAFVGTTTADNFYWDGNDLAGFTEQTVTGSTAWTEGQNLVSAIPTNQTSGDVSAQLIAHSFSTGDAWVLAVNAAAIASSSAGTTTGNRSLGIIFTDGTTTTSNCVAGHIQVSNDATSVLLVGRHGTLTAITTAPWVSIDQGDTVGGWLYIKLIYSAADTFQLLFSSNGVSYSAFGEADISKAMTPTHVGLMCWMENPGSAVMTFGPLKKVA